MPAHDRPAPPARLLGAVALLLFLMWSNSFVAVSFLLGREGSPARLDWVEVALARYVATLPVTLAFCLAVRRRQSLAIARRHPLRLAAAGLLAVPCYNLALYWGQAHGVPAPVASLTTALLPLFVMLLAALFLGERMTRQRTLGFLVALAGMAVIASAKRQVGGLAGYEAAVGVTVLAPLAWATFSIVSKPVAGHTAPPLLWTYLILLVGTLPLAAVAPFRREAILGLDLAGWAAVLFLSYPCTVLGFALWIWLLRHLPASTVGMAVFLNPPLTTLSKVVLSALFPATFAFAVTPREAVGGAVALAGLALAVLPWRRWLTRPR